LTRFIDGDIAGRLARDEITPTQARALNELSRFTGSAIRAAANPNDPMTAFAQEYLGQLLGPGGAGTTGGSGTPAVDPETQQQMASIRLAIDEGQPEAAAESFNNIVERRATADPTASRTDIANQLMQELRIQPGSAGLALTANGSVRPVSSAEYGDAVSLIADAYQRGDRTLSREQAEQQANVYLNRHGVPIRYPEVIEPTVVVTASRIKPFTTGSEIADQIIGGLHGAGLSMVGFFKGIFHTVVDVGRIPFDGWLAIVDLALPETMFADSNQRNAARVDTVNNIIANIDQLPEQVTAYFNGRLARANELEASGDHIGAARERAEMAGDVVLMLENPKSPGAVKILERLGMSPEAIERTVQGLERTIETQRRERILARWAERERDFVLTDANGNKYWDRNIKGGNDVATQLSASLERAGFPKPGDNYTPHHLTGFAEFDRATQRILIEVGITPNSAANGVWLTREQHYMTYSPSYREWQAAVINRYVAASGKPPSIEVVNNALDFIRTTTQNLKPGVAPPWRR
jgi:hypothetical protein